MSDDPRDTQFAGFADLLWKDLDKLGNVTVEGFEGYVRAYKLLIAQRAYDLMRHLISVMPHLVNNANIPTLDAAMQYIPDMTEWPRKQDDRANC